MQTKRIPLHVAMNHSLELGVNYKAFVDLSSKRRIGKVVLFNRHTVWVKVLKGARTYVTVKRHYNKHNVKLDMLLTERATHGT